MLFVLYVAFAADAQVTAIRAGKVVDPETGAVLSNQIILVEERDIKAIGADVKIPAGAIFIDLSKQVVLPGLFDAHSHLCQLTTPDNRDLFTIDMKQTTSYRAILGVMNAKEMLESGFTTVRDVGNNGNYADTSPRRRIRLIISKL